jgi:hypothetical protein
MKRIGLIILIVAFFPKYSLGGDLDSYTRNYLERIENKNGAVCYCLCRSKTDSLYSAAVVIEIGANKGLLIERNGRAVVSLATLSVSAKGFHIEDAHGGSESHDRVNKLVKELSSKHYQLMFPMRMREFENRKAWETYSNKP